MVPGLGISWRSSSNRFSGCHHAEYGDTGRVATGLIETRYQACGDWIAVSHEHNGDRSGCGLDHLRRRLAAGCSDHGHLTVYQIGRERREAIVVTLAPTVFDPNVLAIHEPGFFQTLEEVFQRELRQVVR